MIWRRRGHITALVVFTFLLALILSRMNLARIRHAFSNVSWVWIIGALLLNAVSTYVDAIRWKWILSSVKKDVRVRKAFAAILVGVVGNTVLPFKLGDGTRAYFIAREEGISLASSFSTVMLDRIVEITSFLLLVVLTASFFPFPSSVKRTGLLTGIALGGGWMILIAFMRLSPRLRTKFRGKVGRMISQQISRFTMGLSALRNTGLLLSTTLCSALSWGMRLAVIWATFRAFHLTLPVIAAAVVLVFVNLGIAIANTPANIGGFELSAVAAFKLLSLNAELGISYAIVLHLTEVVPMLLIGLVVLWLSGLESSKLLPPKEFRPPNGVDRFLRAP